MKTIICTGSVRHRYWGSVVFFLSSFSVMFSGNFSFILCTCV